MIKKALPILMLTLSLGSIQVSYAKPKEKAKEKPHVYHVCTNRDSPENVLACSAYHEARGEGLQGMILVASVVLNRKNNDMYPSKIRKVVYQSHQFSYTKGKKLRVYEGQSWQDARMVARSLIFIDKHEFLKNLFTDRTKGSIFFFKKGKEPKWTRKLHKNLTYKNHVFYGEDKK